MIDKKVWVYDIESFGNFFSCIFYNIDTFDKKEFIVCEWIDQFNEFIEFVKSDEMKGMIGFNNIGFDYPLLHKILNTLSQFKRRNGLDKAILIKQFTNNIINSQYSSIRENKVKIPQLDLYKINHFDNKNKATSLKWCEFAMRWKNLQDLPFHHSHMVSKDEINNIMQYNLNDVLATHQLYLECIPKIELRKKLSKKYNLNLLNANDPKIGSEIFAQAICKSKDITWKQLKDQRSYRSEIVLKDCLVDYIDFKSEEFNSILNFFRSKTITETKGVFEDLEVTYKGLTYVYGVGGLHASVKAGVYEPEEDYELWDWDVKMAASRNLVNSGKPKSKDMAILS